MDNTLLIGWYDPGSKRFCYDDVKKVQQKKDYTVPVYAHIDDDVEKLKQRIEELKAENKQLSRDYYCVGTLCNSIDEFGKPIKEEQWTELGERIYEIVAGQLQRIEELEAALSHIAEDGCPKCGNLAEQALK